MSVDINKVHFYSLIHHPQYPSNQRVLLILRRLSDDEIRTIFEGKCRGVDFVHDFSLFVLIVVVFFLLVHNHRCGHRSNDHFHIPASIQAKSPAYTQSLRVRCILGK